MADHHDGDLTLTETEASYQAEIGRLRAELRAGHREQALKTQAALAELEDMTAERDALAARLAAAEKVVEAAEAWRDRHGTRSDIRVNGAWQSVLTAGEKALAAAVDVYRTHEPEPEQT